MPLTCSDERVISVACSIVQSWKRCEVGAGWLMRCWNDTRYLVWVFLGTGWGDAELEAVD